MSAAEGSIGVGAREAAASLLRALAGDSIVLRMPTPPVGDSDAEELGLGSPLFNDITLCPALLQARGANVLVSVCADAVETAVGAGSPAAVEAALLSASFAMAGDLCLQVSQVERREVFGRAYLYRLLLVAPELR